MNEMANIIVKVGANIEHVRQGIELEERIAYRFTFFGCGYSGLCFPKEVQALSKKIEAIGYQAELLHVVEAINKRFKIMHLVKSSRYGVYLLDPK